MWDVLGIEPTNDERAIKRAYAKLLKQNRPDKDPVAFQELRDAYEWCLRATKWTDYDDHDYEQDEDSGEDADLANDGFTNSVDRADAIDDSGPSEEEPDPFLPPDGPVERIVVRDGGDAVASSADAQREAVIVDRRDDEDDLPDGDGWLRSSSDAEIGSVSGEDAVEEGADRVAPSPFETLVAEFESVLGDSIKARQGDVWKAWFDAAEELSLHERQVLRSVIIDLTAIAWHDQPDQTEQILKELPHSAVIGLSDLLGWPHSQVELSEHISDDLVLLLGDVLEFDMITADDRKAFFGASDPAMVDASMRPDTRRHRNAFTFGPFWCLYRRQHKRAVMVIGGPVIISIAAAVLQLAGVQVVVPLALIALFPFFKAGDVRIRWFFACIAAGIAAIWVLGPIGIAPAAYVTLAGALHIEAGIKGRQWREEQLQEAFAAISPDIRTDTDRRHSFLSKDRQTVAPRFMAGRCIDDRHHGGSGVGFIGGNAVKKRLTDPVVADLIVLLHATVDSEKYINVS